MKDIVSAIRPQLHKMGEECFELRQNCQNHMQQYYNWSTKELTFMKYVSGSFLFVQFLMLMLGIDFLYLFSIYHLAL